PRVAFALEPRQPDPEHQNAADRIGMQTGRADPPGRADSPEQRAGLALRHRLPGLERPHRAGVGVLAAGQADLRPCPAGSVLPRAMRMRSPPPLAFHGLAPAEPWPAPPEAAVTSSTFSATSSERRSAPAKPISSSARSRR